ncbi:hypothetical protein ABLN67_02745 [Mycobacterium tuberculosis]
MFGAGFIYRREWVFAFIIETLSRFFRHSSDWVFNRFIYRREWSFSHLS